MPARAPTSTNILQLVNQGSSFPVPENPMGVTKIGCDTNFANKQTEKLSGGFKFTQKLMGLGLKLVFAHGALETQGLVYSVQTVFSGPVS